MPARYLLLFDVDGVLVTRTEAGELTRTPGSWEALSQLQHRSDAVSSLVTQISEEDARAMVGEVTGVGLARYLDLGVGAYGYDGSEPSALVALARRRAQDSYGCAFRVLVVTRASVAEVTQVRDQADIVAAVDSGGAGPDELHAAGAEYVVTSLVELVPRVRGAQVG